MTTIKAFFLLLCACGFSAPPFLSCADVVYPPIFPTKGIAPAPTLKRHPTRSMTIGSVAIHFEKTKLEEVRKAMGIGEIHHRGDGAESSSWLCYSGKEGEVTWRIWLLSNGEMNPEGQIYGIAAMRMAKVSSESSCPILPVAFQSVALDNGLWLNVTQSKIVRHLGNPSARSGGWFHYRSESVLKNDIRAKDRGGEDRVELGGFSVRFDSGRVVELWATFQSGG